MQACCTSLALDRRAPAGLAFTVFETPYPFTPPAVMPCTMKRWAMK